MFGRLRSARLFRGFRGAPPVDLGAVADFVALVSRIAVEHRDRIAEMEFNPVIVHTDGSGITVADALVRLHDGIEPGSIVPIANPPPGN